MNRILCFISALLLALASHTTLAQDHWVATWGAAAVKGAGEVVAVPGVTYRNIVHVSLGGKQVRLTLSNRFGSEPLSIGGVTIAQSTGAGALDSSSLRAVTFASKPDLTIAAGATVISDPVSFDVMPLSDLAVSIYLPAEKISYFTEHPVSHQTNFRSVGNQLRVSSMPDATRLMPWRMLGAIDVMASGSDAAIVAFGDSITDGTGSTNNANRRWPNMLADRLQEDPKYARFAVVDEGIGGNRILHKGGTPEARAGEHPSGLTRWSYDALERSGVKYVILLEGVKRHWPFIADSSRSSGAQAGGVS